MPKSNFKLVTLSQQILQTFPICLDLAARNISDVLGFKANPSEFSSTPFQSRQINLRVKRFDECLVSMEEEIKFIGSETFEFSAFDVASESQLRINRNNDYAVFLLPSVKLSQITIKDLRPLRTKKWERLKMSAISITEKSIL